MNTATSIRLTEWERAGPRSPDHGRILRGLRLDAADEATISQLESGRALGVRALISGIELQATSFVGSVALAGRRIEIVPKIGLPHLMRMVARALGLSDLQILDPHVAHKLGVAGFADLIGKALLLEVHRLARRGLVSNYVLRHEDVPSIRGRVDLRALACRPPRTTVRCLYEDFTAEHALHEALVAGLRAGAHVVADRQLSFGLAREADRLFPDVRRVPLTSHGLADAQTLLDRRSSHYKAAIRLVELIHNGHQVLEDGTGGTQALPGFLLDMNRLFERFLERELQRSAPPGFRVQGQESRPDAYRWLANPRGWRSPQIRPDIVVRSDSKVSLVGDAKYKEHDARAPSTGDLYQLTTYALAYRLAGRRPVLLFHPTVEREPTRRPTLAFGPHGDVPRVVVRLVGVPVARMLEEPKLNAWKLLVEPELN